MGLEKLGKRGALRKVNRALKLDQLSSFAFVEKGQCLEGRKAARCFAKATKIDPNNEWAWRMLGNNRPPDQRWDCLERARDADINVGAALIAMGSVLMDKKDKNGALRLFERSVEVEKWSPWAWTALCLWHRVHGSASEALPIGELAPEVVKTSSVFLLELGRCELKLGNVPGAIARYASATRANPWDLLAWISWLEILPSKPSTEWSELRQRFSELSPEASRFVYRKTQLTETQRGCLSASNGNERKRMTRGDMAISEKKQ
jgi:tetratricopeptide (TPR) repeat protein